MRRQETYAGSLRNVARARRFVAGALVDAGLSPWPADLVATELATNAVRHAKTPFAVTVEVDGQVRVTVADGSPAPPELVSPIRPGAEGGHGLRLIEELATTWGWHCEGSGKEVWAVIPCGPAEVAVDAGAGAVPVSA